MYYASFHYRPLLCLVSRSLKITALVPGGASGVLLKSKFPCKYAYTDSFGLVLDDCNRFNVISTYTNSLNHRYMGNCRSMDANPKIK